VLLTAKGAKYQNGIVLEQHHLIINRNYLQIENRNFLARVKILGNCMSTYSGRREFNLKAQGPILHCLHEAVIKLDAGILVARRQRDLHRVASPA